MNILSWTRHYFWAPISILIDKTICQFPFTSLLLFPIILINWKLAYLLLLSIFIDISIYAFMFMYQHFTSYKNLKHSLNLCLRGDLVILENNIIEAYKLITFYAYRKTILKSLSSIFEINIKVVSSTFLKFKLTTIPDLTGTSFIVVPKRFSFQEERDIILLAHEFGHVFHTLKRYEKLLFPIVLTLYQIALLFYSVEYCSWTIFFLLLPINTFLILKSFFEFESFIECNADLIALQIIETIWGQIGLKKAVVWLIKLRISNSIKTQNKLKRFAINNCIASLAPHISFEDRVSLIESSKKRTSEIIQSKMDNDKKKKDKLANEILIRKYLNTQKKWSSANNLNMNVKSGFTIVLFMVSFFATIYSSYKIIERLDYDYSWTHLLCSIILIISLFFIFKLIFLVIWKEKSKLQEQIGL